MKRIGFIDGRRMRFLDGYNLPFGTGEDITFGWDGAQLNILPATHDIGAINFGQAGLAVDVRIAGANAWAYALFDVGLSRAIFGEALPIMLLGSNRIYFQDTDESIFSAAPGIMQIAALTQVHHNTALSTFAGVLRMDGSQRIQFQDANESIFSAAPGIMQIAALTQIQHMTALSTFAGVLRMDGSQRIQFQDANESIFSAAAGRMQIAALTDIMLNVPLVYSPDSAIWRLAGDGAVQFRSAAARIYAGAVGKLIIQATSGDYDALYISGNVRFMDGDIQMDLLPAANPGVVNRLWNNAGVLSVS